MEGNVRTEEEEPSPQEMPSKTQEQEVQKQVMEESSAAVRADEHPLLAPYFKMLRVGVPEQSIRTKVPYLYDVC